MRKKMVMIILFLSIPSIISSGCGKQGTKGTLSAVSQEAGADSEDRSDGKKNSASKVDNPETEEESRTGQEVASSSENGKTASEKIVSDPEVATEAGSDSANGTKSKSVSEKTDGTAPDNESSADNGPSTAVSGTENSGSEPQESHTHNWVAQTKTVHHAAVTQQVYVVDQAAWDEPVFEEQPVYESVEKCRCKGCGAEFSDFASFEAHSDACMDTGDYNHGSWEVIWDQVQTGTETVQTGTIHHSETGHFETQTLREAYDETVMSGYRCSVCGAEK